MKILVTGGAGYVGSVTARALVEAGHEVVVVDDLSQGRVELVPDGAKLLIGDMADETVLGELAAEHADTLVHFAARAEVALSMREPERFFVTNVAKTAVLLEHLLGAGLDRVVFSSSCAVYGHPVTVPIPDDHPTEPVNPYGETKLQIERMLGWLHRRHGLAFAALRYFNAAGAAPGQPERHDPETHLLPNVLAVAAGERTHVGVFGDDYDTRDGTCVRDFVHVQDLADAHVRALGHLDASSRALTCNLGTGTGASVFEVVETARRVTGRTIPIEVRARRPGDPPVLIADGSWARDRLGWVPRVSTLEDVVGSAWEARLPRT